MTSDTGPSSAADDISLDEDLGELVRGHHVVARLLQLDDVAPRLHYDFVPGLRLEDNPPSFAYWSMRVSDDIGTTYGANDSGAYGAAGGEASPGIRDLGAPVPAEAAQLRLRFLPAWGWQPPGGYRDELVVDLVERRLVERGG